MKIENFVSFPSEKYVFINFDERNTHFFTYTRASSILVTNEEIKSVPSCSTLCRTNYFHEFLLCSIGTKAIDLIERRNKREIVSPKFLPKMGENLKERYLGEGGGGDFRRQLPITLVPRSPSPLTRDPPPGCQQHVC